MSFINKITSDFKRIWIVCFILLALALACNAQVMYPMNQDIPNYYHAEWHVVVPNEGTPRLERMMTHYRCDGNNVYYADKTTNLTYSPLLRFNTRTVEGIEDGLKLTKYASEYKKVLIYTTMEGEFEYLTYHGIKGMYFSLNDEKLAKIMLDNIIEQYNNSLARS